MKRNLRLILAATVLLWSVQSYAYVSNKGKKPGVKNDNPISYRSDCAPATMSYDLAINNVRSRLLNGGDVWWDLKDGQYIVPAVDPSLGVPGVSSIFAGAVWLGGFDDAMNLKIAAQTYRTSTANDFWPGPLSSIGTTGGDTCLNWDRFFVVKGATIRSHIKAFQAALAEGIPFNCETVPDELKKYPARGNPYWSQYYDFDLPNDNQGLGAFFDFNGDNRYDPCDGDYPAIEVKGCPTEANFPDEIVFWVYNDAGNSHTNTNGRPILMEVQVQAFAYATNDQINDMTFQRYKLINRAVLAIDSTYFGMWVDPDLGCASDDFIGCDTTRSLMYIYNKDAVDGDAGCDCTTGSTTYCNDVPILGVDYFRGPLKPVRETADTFHISELPLDKQDYPHIYDTVGYVGDTLIILDVDHRIELGMSSFTYYVNNGIGNPPSQITDPQQDVEYYRLLSGSWRDGRPFTQGGNGYNIGPGAKKIKYAFPGDPNDAASWSMCTASLAAFDQRGIQATGPFRLDPGAINELIIGAVWVPDQTYPCPELDELRAADDLAQALFNNCFILPNGPDAPDLDWIELDRELIMVLSNDTKSSNNANEAYRERGLEVPAGTEDSTYKFEGYLVYQLANGNVTNGELEDVNKARLVFQVDKRNGVSKIYNWTTVIGPNNEPVWVPVLQVEGADAGIKHTFQIKEDQFASSDRRLVNHKHYYYTAIAYAYNEYEPFDPKTLIGQRTPYLEGRGNIRVYDPLPHPQTFKMINGMYGEGPIVTRLEGVGAGENFLELADGEYKKILADSTGGEVTYRPGAAPIRVQVFNPLVVKDGEYIIKFVDPYPSDTLSLSSKWYLFNDAGDTIAVANQSIAQLSEQLVADLGISILIGQSDDAGDRKDPSNGTIGYSLTYSDPAKPAWLTFITDDLGGLPITNFIQTELTPNPDPNYYLDPDRVYSTFAPWVPFILVDYKQDEPAENQQAWNITPGWMDPSGGLVQSPQFGGNLQHLNNVDIIITSDTSKWSRCVVVETANVYFTDPIYNVGLSPEGNKKSLQPRARLSVGRYDANGDGWPDPDGAKDANGNPLTGMGWFPGFAVDVETGERLNIFFGENSVYDSVIGPNVLVGNIANDMIWNPGKQILLPGTDVNNISNIIPIDLFAGGQQYVYVTRTKYDACASLRKDLDRTGLVKARALAAVTWCTIPLTIDDPTVDLLPLNEGLIPNDVTVKLRVDNPYQKATGNGQYSGYPTYRFKLEGVTAQDLTEDQIPEALAEINVVPNPYLAYAEYETSSFDNVVKITNLPAQCTVTIYSLDGRFIRQYTRNEVGKPNSPPRTNPPVAVNQIVPDLEWNLKNSAGIPVASGIYLIHVEAPGLGERVIKWFGVGRQFDPSGL